MLAEQMSVVFDEAMNLQIASSWYDDVDPQYGGPSSKDQLTGSIARLKAAYLKMALLTGLDPCEQLPSTKDRLKQQKSSRNGLDQAPWPVGHHSQGGSRQCS